MVKLTDFGFSNKFCPGQKLETSCGSLAYSAPEILLGDSYDAPAVGEFFIYQLKISYYQDSKRELKFYVLTLNIIRMKTLTLNI